MYKNISSVHQKCNSTESWPKTSRENWKETLPSIKDGSCPTRKKSSTKLAGISVDWEKAQWAKKRNGDTNWPKQNLKPSFPPPAPIPTPEGQAEAREVRVSLFHQVPREGGVKPWGLRDPGSSMALIPQRPRPQYSQPRQDICLFPLFKSHLVFSLFT